MFPGSSPARGLQLKSGKEPGNKATLHTHICTCCVHSYYTTAHIQGGEGQTILNRELSECAVIRLSPEQIQPGAEDQDGGVALLRSRVEQQSTLIAMLKQRGDETLREVSVG